MDSAVQALVPETPSSPAGAVMDDADGHHVLARAARPVIDQLARDLAGTGIGLELTNASGHVVHRAIRPPLDRQPDRARAVAPITDPDSGRTVGTLDLTSPAAGTNPLMQPFVIRAAREIEQRLLDHSGLAERFALRRFLQERRGAKGPFVLVTDRHFIPNAAADRLVGPEDETAVREAADRLRAGRSDDVVTLVVRGGAAAARARRAPDDMSSPGVVVQLEPLPQDDGRSCRLPERTPAGWDDLTDTERSVAQLVAEGLTNREAAERLFLSPHTVDFHLRSIFRKLGASSRVRLTRLIVLTQHDHKER
jgi:DNA-binding CsgD family transcriptional regulator